MPGISDVKESGRDADVRPCRSLTHYGSGRHCRMALVWPYTHRLTTEEIAIWLAKREIVHIAKYDS